MNGEPAPMPANQSTPEVTRAEELRALIAKATNERLSDGGRYFAESCDDLTRCRHEEIGEYQHSADGELIEWLWNRRSEIADLYARSATPARGGDELREALVSTGEALGFLIKFIGPTREDGSARLAGMLDRDQVQSVLAAANRAALASTDMAGASVPDRLARRMGAEFVARDDVPPVEGLTSGEVDATGWHVNPHTPSVIITPHGRISIGWSVQAEGSSNDYSLAEAAAALIVKAVSSLAASPKATATASVREDCAAACDRIATGSVYIGESEEGRARHEGIIAGARNCAAAIRRLTDSGTAATIGGERFANDAVAKALYDTWADQPGWVPWVDRGNSDMQERARREAML